jgi:uncharacterized protein YeaO (DUF488 family)
MTLDVNIKRVYDAAEPGDGYRVLIDHVWPRGVSHERAHLDGWARELAPSDELRRWFDHVPERFDEFRARYRDELSGQAEVLEGLRERASQEPLTIVYAARDREHNNAVVLRELLLSAPPGKAKRSASRRRGRRSVPSAHDAGRASGHR